MFISLSHYRDDPEMNRSALSYANDMISFSTYLKKKIDIFLPVFAELTSENESVSSVISKLISPMSNE